MRRPHRPYAARVARRLLVAGALLAVPAVASAQAEPAGRACPQHASGPEAAAVDSVFAPWDRADGPGAAVAVLRDGEIVLEKGYGSAQIEYGVPVGPCTVFHVASVTKQFIAFGVAILAEEGTLSPDDDVREHLPWLPDFGEPIRLRQLVHHTSGLRDQWQLLALGGWRLDDVITQDQILDAVSRQRGLNFPPGTEHLYSNTGYTLLAEVIERATGTPFPAWMEERVFRSHVLRLPEDRLGVVVVGNAASMNPASLVRRVADAYLGAGPEAGTKTAAAAPDVDPELSGPTLDALTGRFEVDGIGLVEVRRDDGGLALDAGGPAIPLRPRSDSVFQAPERNLLVTFRRDEERRVTGLRIETPSGQRRGDRLPDLDLTASDLEAFVGDYFSSELRTLYRADLREEERTGSTVRGAAPGDGEPGAPRLLLSHPKHGEIPLEPAGEDAFTTERWFLPKISFTRNDAGRVTGFEVSGGRVLGLRFERLSLAGAGGPGGGDADGPGTDSPGRPPARGGDEPAKR